MSTRRARIKAVAALPPRRKNVDVAKKKEEELKEGFESEVKPTSSRRLSSDKTPKDKVDSAQENTKEGYEDTVSPTKRRLSVEKTQGQRRISVDKSGHTSTNEGCGNDPKTPKTRRLSVEKTQGQCLISVDKSEHTSTSEGCGNEPKTPRPHQLSIDKTPKRRLSIDKTPKRRMSIDKTPAKRLSVDAITQDLSIDKTDSITKLSDKSPNKTSPNKSDKDAWYPNSKILKSLLNAAETKPKYFPHKSAVDSLRESNAKALEKFMSECKPSSSKEGLSDNENESKKSTIAFFASPRIRSSPRPPIVRTPIIEVDLIAEKMIAPHKGPNSVNREISYMEIHAADVKQRLTKPEVEVIVEKIISNDEITELDNALTTAKSKCPIKIIDEYVIKPTPDKATVDGIVPLKPVSKAPKPLDLLKNEIISENAEVLFDPIVPLPSPSKVRPKLRPVPRLGPRRNSFQQGSASESEDENRRLHGRPPTPATPIPPRQRHDSHTSHASIMQRDVARVRNDSVCSTVSQAPSQTAAVSSPMREREKSLKTRREEMTARRNAALRRRQTEVERDKLTMYDLIFYNPKANPIIPDQDELNAKEANKKEEEDRKASATQGSSKAESPEAAPVAVPQIKLGPNGEIVLDEQSLVVNQSDQRQLEASVVREGAWGGSSSRAYRRTPRTADWSDAETVRFYRAIATMGTDFTLMQPLFPTRSRRDLKLKFKKEERLNLAQVDMALRSGAEWDPSRLETEFTEERKAAEEAAKNAKERLKREKAEEKERERDMKNHRTRRSKCAKTLGDSAMPKRSGQSKDAPCTLDEYVKFQEERTRSANQRKNKKKNLGDFDLSSRSRRRSPSPPFATLTLVDKSKQTPKKPTPRNDMATITREVTIPPVPPNIETGSLVVLTVNDPKSPSRKMLQTYIAQGPGNLAPVSLPANFLNSVVGFMKKTNSPGPTVMGSPSAGRSKTPNILTPRKRTSSYTITQL